MNKNYSLNNNSIVDCRIGLHSPIILFCAVCMIFLFSSFSTKASSGSTSNFENAKFNMSLDNSLLSFTGRYVEDKDLNVINWIAPSDKNTDFFTLERSIENGEFEVIAKLDAKGTGGVEALYSFNDKDISFGGTYNYRVQQVSSDSSSVYSDLISIKVHRLQSEPSVKVFPDPASELVNVDIVKGKADVVSVNLFDLTGKEIALSNVNVSAGGSFASIQIPVKELARAAYILRINVGDQVFAKKVKLVKKNS